MKYTGHINNKNFRPTRYGIFEYPDSSIYRGEIKDGHITGWGIKEYPGLGEFDGQWVDGQMHGTVMITKEKTGAVEKWIFEKGEKVKQIWANKKKMSGES